MKLLILLAHPNPASFNHALAGKAADTAKLLGHEIWFHDLCAEKFDPCYTESELAKGAVLPTVIDEFGRKTSEADGINHCSPPNWWSTPPAVLKGWVDRVLRAGRHYRFEPDGKGGGRSVGMLKAKSALIITTANTPQAKEVEFYGDPLDTFWKKNVFGLCGVPNCHRVICSPVIVSSPAQREQWLAEVEQKIKELYPRG